MSATVLRSTDFAAEAAALIVAQGHAAIARYGLFRLGLCGGSTPRPIYAALAKSDLPWDRVQITFGDERCVPPEDAQSNYRMAKEAWLGQVPLPEGNVLRMRGELPPQEAAAAYEAQLAAIARRFQEPRYRHDLLLLGMGDDGHTASLFPGTTALEEKEANIVANHVPKLDAWRLTMTFPLLNAARKIVFLINDPAKEPVIQQVLAKSGGYPSEQIAPTDGELLFFLGHQP